MKPIILIILFYVFALGMESGQTVEVFVSPTFSAEKLIVKPVPFETESGWMDTLFVRYNQKGQPHSYYRHFLTEVCMTKECRPLDIYLYWNVTGRYLGYSLPPGEFLSKTDHVKFKPEDYQKLSDLMTDPHSGLKNYKLEELVPGDYSDTVDAVSAATIADVKQYIVKDAVYTTYVIWHLLYGSEKQRVEALTRQKLNAELLVRILESDNKTDVAWGLENIPEEMVWSTDLQNVVFQWIKSDDRSLSGLAVQSIPVSMLDDELVQKRMLDLFQDDKTSFLLKKKLLMRLEDARMLYPSVQQQLAASLSKLNGSMVNQVLDLFATHQIKNKKTEEVVAGLLMDENRFVARKAYEYLSQYETDNKKIDRLLRKYENQ